MKVVRSESSSRNRDRVDRHRGNLKRATTALLSFLDPRFPTLKHLHLDTYDLDSETHNKAHIDTFKDLLAPPELSTVSTMASPVSVPPGLFSLPRMSTLLASLLVALGSGTNYVRKVTEIWACLHTFNHF